MDFVYSLRNPKATTSSVFVDNLVFTLHHKFTSVILLICSLIVTFIILINPITCRSGDYPPHEIDTECWMMKSFTFPVFYSRMDGFKVLYPEIKPNEPHAKVFHAYYQSIYIILFVQAVMFYAPGYFWKVMERDRIKKLIIGLGLDYPALPEETRRISARLLANYVLSGLHSNGMYFFYFVAAEILNFINVVVQACLIDKAFDGEFSTHGLNVFQFSGKASYERNDTMAEVFPKFITCTLHVVDRTGDMFTRHTTCSLPINGLSEKIYIFLWFWFLILATLSGIVLVYRLAVASSPWVRFFVLKSRNTLSRADHLRIIAFKFPSADWFVLDLVAKNVDPQNFRVIVHDLTAVLEPKHELLDEDEI